MRGCYCAFESEFMCVWVCRWVGGYVWYEWIGMLVCSCVAFVRAIFYFYVCLSERVSSTDVEMFSRK